MDSPHVYDKAKYHSGTVRKYGLSSEHASNHTVMFLRWLVEHHMTSDLFEQEGKAVLQKFRAGKVSIHKLYKWWDGCLIDDMLSEEGNAFAMHYFDFENGQFLPDYTATLQGSLPSEYHIVFSEENFQMLRKVIDRRYDEWKGSRAERPKS
jgi:hypothetical protein